jgi:hypothetical protein
VFAPETAPHEWFVVDGTSTLFPRLSMSAEQWLERVSCLQPMHFVTQTQSLYPTNQFAQLQAQQWEQFSGDLNSESAVIDIGFKYEKFCSS